MAVRKPGAKKDKEKTEKLKYEVAQEMGLESKDEIVNREETEKP